MITEINITDEDLTIGIDVSGLDVAIALNDVTLILTYEQFDKLYKSMKAFWNPNKPREKRKKDKPFLKKI